MSEFVKDWVAEAVALVVAFIIGSAALAQSKTTGCITTPNPQAAHSESSR